MPVVDDVVVLDARVSTGPSCLRDLVEKLSCVNFFDDFTVCPGAKAKLATVFDGVHELCVYADRVVGVLVLNRVDVPSAKLHVVTGVAQYANLLFFKFLGLDELNDVRVINI